MLRRCRSLQVFRLSQLAASNLKLPNPQAPQNLQSRATMSSTTTTTTATKPESPTSAPIDLLDNDIARIYTHLHPLLLLSLFYFQFNALVANPVQTLLSSLVPLALLQIAYCILCLPPTTGSSSPQAKVAGKKGKSGKGKDELSIVNRLIVRLRPLQNSMAPGLQCCSNRASQHANAYLLYSPQSTPSS